MSVISTLINKEEKRKRPNVGDCIDDKYDVIRELGEGGFGAVLEVVDRATKQNYAIKIELELPAPDEPGLDVEALILKKLQGKQHILKYISEGRIGQQYYLVMQIAGKNLSDLRKICENRHFTLSTSTRIAIKCMDAIEVVHGAGFLHRDIKPANFAVGRGKEDARKIYILDFGLVRKFRLKTGEIRPPRIAAGFRGSVRYASVNCHNRVDLGRGDDLWCWLYSVIEMQKGKLPWSKEEKTDKVGEMKRSIAKEDLLRDMDVEYYVIYQHLTTLKYESIPAYDIYKKGLKEILKRFQCDKKEPFDWETRIKKSGSSKKKQTLLHPKKKDTEDEDKHERAGYKEKKSRKENTV